MRGKKQMPIKGLEKRGGVWGGEKGGCCKTWKLCNRLFLSFSAQCYKNHKEKSNICFEYWLFFKLNVWEIAPAILFLCLLSYNFIQHNIPCTSQRGIAFPLWKPLLLKQQYPVRVTWRFLSKSGGCRPLTRFYGNRKIVLKRRMASLNSVRPRCLQPRVCRNSSGKLLSHPFAGLTALRGVPPRELPAGCIKEFCNSRLVPP